MSIHIPRRKQLLARVLSVLLAISPFATLAPAAYATGDCGCGESTTDLIAGGGNENSALDVGEVTVSSCEDGGVCVEYSLSDEAIDEGWVITETHAAVGNTEGDIPQTKKGNPTPGQFSHNETHDGVTSFKVCFEGNYAPGDELVVAAHAVVVKPTDEWGKVWQIGDVEGTLENGLPTNYANEFNWGPPADEETAGPSLAEDSPAFANPYVVGVNNPEDFPYNSNTLRGYATNFDINWTGELPFGGRLLVSWSPGQSADEVKVVTIAGQETILEATGVPTPGGFLDIYPLAPLGEAYVGALPYGQHTININHTQGDGTFYDWLRLEQPGLQSETAWGDGDPFVDKGNWATYITYTFEECCTEPPDIADPLVVFSYEQGKLKNGGNVAANRSDPNSVTGPDDPFFSLGFVDHDPVAGEPFNPTAPGGHLIVTFPCPVVNGDGDDLRIVERTNGTYPLEQAEVYAWSGGDWVLVGVVDNDVGGATPPNRPDGVDLEDGVGGPVASATTFKIVDITNPAIHSGNADGYDIQYIEALNGACCP